MAYTNVNAYSSSAPPPYSMNYDPGPARRSKWNPKSWPRWLLFTLVGIVIFIIIIIIAAAVKASKSSAYPDYTKLTYSLEDSYSGTDFFDNFDYFTGYDPSSGFVQ